MWAALTGLAAAVLVAAARRPERVAAIRDLVFDWYGGDPIDPGFDQLLGGDPVDVDVVDDRDVPGSQALDQMLGPRAEPRGTFDRPIRPLSWLSAHRRTWN